MLKWVLGLLDITLCEIYHILCLRARKKKRGKNELGYKRGPTLRLCVRAPCGSVYNRGRWARRPACTRLFIWIYKQLCVHGLCTQNKVYSVRST